MFNVCPGCGEYSADKVIEGEYAVCAKCGFQHKFRRLPLFVLTGASEVGKTTICLALAARASDFVIMAGDILLARRIQQGHRRLPRLSRDVAPSLQKYLSSRQASGFVRDCSTGSI